MFPSLFPTSKSMTAWAADLEGSLSRGWPRKHGFKSGGRYVRTTQEILSQNAGHTPDTLKHKLGKKSLDSACQPLQMGPPRVVVKAGVQSSQQPGPGKRTHPALSPCSLSVPMSNLFGGALARSQVPAPWGSSLWSIIGGFRTF